MTETVNIPLADTSDMVQVHQVFRDALGAAAPLVGSASADDRERVELVHGYYLNVLALLQGHHDGEDLLLWPKLVQRAPDDAPTVQRIAAQHESVLASLKTAESRLAEWYEDPSIDRGASLASALAVLGAELAAHLAEEERVVLPLAAVHITAPEWGQLPEHGLKTFTGDKVWLVLGLIREQMRPEQIETMDAHMPPPVVDFWYATGKQQFDEYVAALRS
jgi:hypothetical protein